MCRKFVLVFHLFRTKFTSSSNQTRKFVSEFHVFQKNAIFVASTFPTSLMFKDEIFVKFFLIVYCFLLDKLFISYNMGNYLLNIFKCFCFILSRTFGDYSNHMIISIDVLTVFSRQYSTYF